MDHIHQCPDVFDGSLGQNSMAEIEDVAGPAGRLLKDAACLTLDLRYVGEQDDGIEIALHGDLGTESCPGSRKVDAPVEPDHRTAGVALQFQKRSRIGAEMNRRRSGIKLGKEPCHVGLDEPAVIFRTEVSDPAIKNLNNLSARCDLSVQVKRSGVDEPRHQRIPGAGIAVHEGLRGLVMTRAASLDGVARQGERSPGEADERCRWLEGRPDRAHGFVHKVKRRWILQRTNPVDIAASARPDCE